MWKNSNIKPGLLISLVIAIGLIFTAKSSGWLQPVEWIVLDLFFQLRPPEPIDRRIVIVTLTEDDIEKLDEYPISDEKLAVLLMPLNQEKHIPSGPSVLANNPMMACFGLGAII